MLADLKDLKRSLGQMSPQELAKMALELGALERALNVAGPQTDDELHAWLKMHLDVDIPRVAVCDGHCSPFQFLADNYFERTLSSLAMANRGGSKTFNVAVLHLLNSKFKPGCDSMSLGAVESQALRAYEHLRRLLLIDGKVDVPEDNPDVATSIMRETRWKNGSRVEVVPGTINAVNGPHPQKVHGDEIELMDPIVFQESRNMRASKGNIKGQDILTSTRKRAHGQMQKIIDDINESVEAGRKPAYDLYIWCAFESAAPVDCCQKARPDLEPSQQCDCHLVQKGKWEDGSARLFSDVCGGRLFRSRGWIPLQDLQQTFQATSRDVWEAQQECKKPSTEGTVFPMYSKERHCIKGFDADPENGPIYMSVDYGGTNPHAVSWYQVLTQPVPLYVRNALVHEASQTALESMMHEMPVRTLPVNTVVVFDEIYRAEAGNAAIIKAIKIKEAGWRRKHKGWSVTRRFGDPAAKAARLDYGEAGLPISFFATRDIKEQVGYCVELFEAGLFALDISRCPMFAEELEAYHYPEHKAGTVDDPEVPVDDFNHQMSAFRYFVANYVHASRKGRARKGAAIPAAAGGLTVVQLQRATETPAMVGLGVQPEPTGLPSYLFDDQSWRGSL